MTVQLAPAQERALDAIGRWLRESDEQSFVLGGYAGTGKTTIMRHLIESVNRPVRCCTPTGKAASVLASKLPEGMEVSTIHSFLYQPVEVTVEDLKWARENLAQVKRLHDKARGAERSNLFEEMRFAEANVRRIEDLLDKGACEFARKDDPVHAPIVIVDEASMVGEEIEADLRRAAGKILFLGDPGQLPPVQGTDFFVRNPPQVVLEEVHRQAADSPILRLSMAIRNDEHFGDWDSEVCRLVRGRPNFDEIEDAQFITGRNDTRRKLNRSMRRRRGHSELYPELGEPIMCLRNDHGRGFINGVPGVAASPCGENSFGDLVMDISYSGVLHKKIPVDPYHFHVYEDPKLSRRANPPRDYQFDFGYAITVHKAQGSEWPHVVVWDDKMRVQDVESRRRWMYTAVTRASERLTWVNPK